MRFCTPTEDPNQSPKHTSATLIHSNMKFLFAFYNSERDGQCLTTALINNSQALGLTNARLFGTYHGDHPGNEFHLHPDDIELTHAYSLFATTRIVAGSPNDYISHEAHNVDGREIEEGTPNFHAFSPSDDQATERERFLSYIQGDRPATMMFIRFCVQIIGEGEDIEQAHHFGNITALGHDKFWFSHGILCSTPVMITRTNLPHLLFTERGRARFTARVQTDFLRAGTQCIVSLPDDIFLAVPKIQLRDPVDWSGTSNQDIRYTGETFFDNSNVNERDRRMHMYMIVDSTEMEDLDAGFNSE